MDMANVPNKKVYLGRDVLCFLIFEISESDLDLSVSVQLNR